MYTLIKSPFTQIIDTVRKDEDNSFIPMNEANTDYQAYLKWLDEGNTPEQADNV